MRLKYFIAALAVLVLSFGCAKLPGVTKVGGDETKGKDGTAVAMDDGVGLYYALPLTVVKVEMPMKMTYEVKDNPKTGKKKVGASAKFSGATITTQSIPDPGNVYKVTLEGRAFNDLSYMLKRSEVGHPLSVGAGAVNRASDVVAEFVRYSSYVGFGWVTGGITMPLPGVESSSPTLEQRKPEAATEIPATLAEASIDQVEGAREIEKTVNSDFCNKQIKVVEKAVLARQRILFGCILPSANGDAIKYRVERLDEIEKQYKEKCDKIKEEEFKIVFYANPQNLKDGKPFKVPLMQIYPRSGYIRYLSSPYDVVDRFVAAHNKDVAKGSEEYRKLLEISYNEWMTDESEKMKHIREQFVFLEIEPCNSIGEVLRHVGIKPSDAGKSMYYREPGIGKVKVTHGHETIASADIPIAQFGVVASLPQGYRSKEASHDILFYANSGSINSMAINTTGHTATDTKAYYESMAEILNANLKLQQQQKAADAAAAKSASTTATTTATP